jgi:hypothetical protein
MCYPLESRGSWLQTEQDFTGEFISPCRQTDVLHSYARVAEATVETTAFENRAATRRIVDAIDGLDGRFADKGRREPDPGARGERRRVTRVDLLPLGSDSLH